MGVFIKIELLFLCTVVALSAASKSNIVHILTTPPIIELKERFSKEVGLQALEKKTVKESATTGRIVSGSVANPGQFPFVGLALAFVGDINGTALCTCSLITRTFVLYAAHCINFPNIVAAQFFFGSADASKFTQIRNGSRVIKHPMYNFLLTNMNDIALGELETPVTLNENVKLVKLPTRTSRSYASETLTPIGFGLDESGRVSKFLRFTQLKGQSDLTCFFWFPFTPKLICAQSESRSGICFGDSGGPLMFGDTQVGINDMLKATVPADPANDAAICEKGQNAFVRVDQYLSWISSYTKA